MPKKFNGINQKAVAAQARKTAAEELKLAKVAEEEEQALWQDNDKHVLRKIKRKEEREKKKLSVFEKKAEKKILLEREMDEIKSKSAGSSKITVAQIESKTRKGNLNETCNKTVQKEQVLEENINHFVDDEINARNVTEAIAALDFQEVVPMNYKAFEKSRLEEIKKENPTLRLNQIKQMIFKEWERRPKNSQNKS